MSGGWRCLRCSRMHSWDTTACLWCGEVADLPALQHATATADTTAADLQEDLFGAAHPAEHQPRRVPRESNDIELMYTLAANAVRCGYLLVGAHQRVYARVNAHTEVARVPGYEDDAVHQLLRRRWLTLGASHHLTCGAATLTGVAVLVSRDTRTRLLRWAHQQHPPCSPSPPAHPSPTPNPTARGTDSTGRVIELDRLRRRR